MRSLWESRLHTKREAERAFTRRSIGEESERTTRKVWADSGVRSLEECRNVCIGRAPKPKFSRLLCRCTLTARSVTTSSRRGRDTMVRSCRCIAPEVRASVCLWFGLSEGSTLLVKSH